MNYTPTDLLLVFRQDGQKDVEFDLGSITNFLGKPAGTRVTVAYDSATVLANFSSLDGVRFGLVAASGQTDSQPRVWVTDATIATAPSDLTYSAFGVLRDKIESVGIAATLATLSNSAPYAVSTSSSSSYDYLVTSGIGSAVSTMYGDSPVPMGGVVPLPVDGANPTSLALYEVQVSTANPKPAATLSGSFTLDAKGGLTFTAGQVPPLPPTTILNISADIQNNMNTITFNTTNGVNYQLLYSTVLRSNWAPVPGAGTAAGDGTVQSLTDYNPSDAARFYRVQSTY